MAAASAAAFDRGPRQTNRSVRSLYTPDCAPAKRIHSRRVKNCCEINTVSAAMRTRRRNLTLDSERDSPCVGLDRGRPIRAFGDGHEIDLCAGFHVYATRGVEEEAFRAREPVAQRGEMTRPRPWFDVDHGSRSTMDRRPSRTFRITAEATSARRGQSPRRAIGE